MSGWSGDYNDMMQSMGMRSKSLQKKVRANIYRYDLTLGIDTVMNKKAVEYLTYAAKKYERRLERYLAKGKARSLRKADKVRDLLNQIYERIRPDESGLESLVGSAPGLKTGAARPLNEGRIATILLGGSSGLLGLSSGTPPGAPSVTPTPVAPTDSSAREFLGLYYGGRPLGYGRFDIP